MLTRSYCYSFITQCNVSSKVMLWNAVSMCPTVAQVSQVSNTCQQRTRPHSTNEFFQANNGYRYRQRSQLSQILSGKKCSKRFKYILFISHERGLGRCYVAAIPLNLMDRALSHEIKYV